MLREQFAEHDKDGSGKLDRADLAIIAREKDIEKARRQLVLKGLKGAALSAALEKATLEIEARSAAKTSPASGGEPKAEVEPRDAATLRPSGMKLRPVRLPPFRSSCPTSRPIRSTGPRSSSTTTRPSAGRPPAASERARAKPSRARPAAAHGERKNARNLLDYVKENCCEHEAGCCSTRRGGGVHAHQRRERAAARPGLAGRRDRVPPVGAARRLDARPGRARGVPRLRRRRLHDVPLRLPHGHRLRRLVGRRRARRRAPPARGAARRAPVRAGAARRVCRPSRRALSTHARSPPPPRALVSRG